MPQAPLVIPNSNGATYRGNVNNAFGAVASCNSGTSAPSSPLQGQLWLDNASGTAYHLKVYDGADWFTLISINPATNLPFSTQEQVSLVNDPTSDNHAVKKSMYDVAFRNIYNGTLAGNATPASGGEFQIANASSAARAGKSFIYNVFDNVGTSGLMAAGRCFIGKAGEVYGDGSPNGISLIGVGINWGSPPADKFLIGRESGGDKIVFKNTTAVPLRVIISSDYFA